MADRRPRTFAPHHRRRSNSAGSYERRLVFHPEDGPNAQSRRIAIEIRDRRQQIPPVLVTDENVISQITAHEHASGHAAEVVQRLIEAERKSLRPMILPILITDEDVLNPRPFSAGVEEGGKWVSGGDNKKKRSGSPKQQQQFDPQGLSWAGQNFQQAGMDQVTPTVQNIPLAQCASPPHGALQGPITPPHLKSIPPHLRTTPPHLRAVEEEQDRLRAVEEEQARLRGVEETQVLRAAEKAQSRARQGTEAAARARSDSDGAAISCVSGPGQGNITPGPDPDTGAEFVSRVIEMERSQMRLKMSPPILLTDDTGFNAQPDNKADPSGQTARHDAQAPTLSNQSIHRPRIRIPHNLSKAPAVLAATMAASTQRKEMLNHLSTQCRADTNEAPLASINNNPIAENEGSVASPAFNHRDISDSDTHFSPRTAIPENPKINGTRAPKPPIVSPKAMDSHDVGACAMKTEEMSSTIMELRESVSVLNSKNEQLRRSEALKESKIAQLIVDRRKFAIRLLDIKRAVSDSISPIINDLARCVLDSYNTTPMDSFNGHAGFKEGHVGNKDANGHDEAEDQKIQPNSKLHATAREDNEDLHKLQKTPRKLRKPDENSRNFDEPSRRLHENHPLLEDFSVDRIRPENPMGNKPHRSRMANRAPIYESSASEDESTSKPDIYSRSPAIVAGAQSATTPEFTSYKEETTDTNSKNEIPPWSPKITNPPAITIDFAVDVSAKLNHLPSRHATAEIPNCIKNMYNLMVTNIPRECSRGEFAAFCGRKYQMIKYSSTQGRIGTGGRATISFENKNDAEELLSVINGRDIEGYPGSPLSVGKLVTKAPRNEKSGEMAGGGGKYPFLSGLGYKQDKKGIGRSEYRDEA